MMANIDLLTYLEYHTFKKIYLNLVNNLKYETFLAKLHNILVKLHIR